MDRPRFILAAIAAAVVLRATLVGAEPAGDPETAELARQDQNPITRFYVMRFEDNLQLGFGPNDEALNFFRIQPLIPLRLSRDWILVTRLIVPIVHSPWPDSADGLSDISVIGFLTPATSGEFIWGIGPALLLPTATDEALGTEKWSAGPAVAGVYTRGPWVVGAVVQNLWSFAGDDDRLEVNTMTLRPILDYNLPKGWYLTSSPSIGANWKAERNSRWLVPLGGGVGKVFSLGGQRMSATLESYYHVESPSIGPDWQLRMQLSFLYPER